MTRDEACARTGYPVPGALRPLAGGRGAPAARPGRRAARVRSGGHAAGGAHGPGPAGSIR
jgi:hypothetical protein